MTRLVGWCLLVVWCAWMFALQGLWASSSLGAWTPDLGLVVLLSLDRRLDRSDAFLAVAIVAGARIGFTCDPPLMIVVGYAAMVALVRRMRRVAEIDHLLSRSVLGGLGAALLGAYWSIGRDVALAANAELFGPQDRGALSAATELSTDGLWTSALATALAVAFLGPLLVRLPGISPLRRSPR